MKIPPHLIKYDIAIILLLIIIVIYYTIIKDWESAKLSLLDSLINILGTFLVNITAVLFGLHLAKHL